MSEPRTYCIGLPVVITVHPDGKVDYEIDLSEASDLWEGVPTDDRLQPLYTDAEVEADIAVVSADTDRIYAERATKENS